jgi:uncharacterized membrane protein YtjA (UPF0391 family)
MLRFAMLSLVCCVSCGVFGYGGGAAASWTWVPAMFYVFLGLSIVGFLGGTLPRPAELREARILDRSSSLK